MPPLAGDSWLQPELAPAGASQAVTAASERGSRVYKRHRSSGGDIAQNNGREFLHRVCVCLCCSVTDSVKDDGTLFKHLPDFSFSAVSAHVRCDWLLKVPTG